MTSVSFEFYPPKSLAASFRLWETMRSLAPLAPSFVSVTYGAGGSTRDLTHEAVTTLGRHFGVEVAAHLTCVDASRAETMAIVDRYAAAGVTRIVALRGDPPDPARGFTPHPEGFAHACELISALADDGRFDICVGAYPDRHPEAASGTADVEWLKRKVDAGATRAITQFFFEAESFFRFRDACTAAGIGVPILPGILPIESWTGVERFAARCGTPVPAWMPEAFARAERDGRAELLATAICTELCTELLEGGVDHLHFYTLNKPNLTRDVVHALGLAPPAALQDVA